MSTIIVATDFSDVATNAVQYACDMAKDFGVPVLVTHSYVIPVTFQENPMPVVSMEESKSTAKAQMDKLISTLKEQYPGLDITGNIHYGDITDSLKESIPHHKAWLVVVGNSSAGDSSFWLGSNLLSTLRNLQCPVVAVPEGYSYKKVGKIAFACDFQNLEDNLPADDLVSLVQKSGGQLHVLSVDHDNRHFDPDTPYEYEVLEESLHAAHPEFHHIDNEDVEEGIRSFISSEDVDWLVVVPHKHSFFESLFHKSQTKAIVRHAYIPIVALHEKA